MTSFSETNFSGEIQRYVVDLASLTKEFTRRFKDFEFIESDIMLFSSPFTVESENAPGPLQLEHIELQNDAECRNRHQMLPLIDFYLQLDKERFKEIRRCAKKCSA